MSALYQPAAPGELATTTSFYVSCTLCPQVGLFASSAGPFACNWRIAAPKDGNVRAHNGIPALTGVCSECVRRHTPKERAR